jgi:hypothetical membrane protein
MEHVMRRLGMVMLGLAAGCLVALHALPQPMLHSTTGALIPYQPTNFLSEFVRTDYGPLMTTCFFLLALGALATATTLRSLRREAVLLAIAGVALALLGFFPTDLSELTTNNFTCGAPERIEPCTMVGNIHNPLSTVVFAPIFLTALSFCVRSRKERQWRGVSVLALICGVLAVFGVVAATVYLQSLGWHGRWWTGLMQRSLVIPALIWMAGLLIAIKDLAVKREPVPRIRRTAPR